MDRLGSKFALVVGDCLKVALRLISHSPEMIASNLMSAHSDSNAVLTCDQDSWLEVNITELLVAPADRRTSRGL